MPEPMFIQVRDNEHYRISDIREFYKNANYRLVIVFETLRRNWSITIEDKNQSDKLYAFLKRYSVDPIHKDLKNV